MLRTEKKRRPTGSNGQGGKNVDQQETAGNRSACILRTGGEKGQHADLIALIVAEIHTGELLTTDEGGRHV